MAVFPGIRTIGQPIGIQQPFGIAGLSQAGQAPVAPELLEIPHLPALSSESLFAGAALAPSSIGSTGGGILNVVSRLLQGQAGQRAQERERDVASARARGISETFFPGLTQGEATTDPERLALVGQLLGDESISLAAAQAQITAGLSEQFSVLTSQQEIQQFGSDLPGQFQQSSRTGKTSLISGTAVTTDAFEPVLNAAGETIAQRNRRTDRIVADPTVTRPSAEDEFKIGTFTQGLRKEAAAVSGDFTLQEQAWSRIKAVAFEADGVTVRQTPASSLALIFNFMKMLDPNSVVRESEFRTAAKARAWLERQEDTGIIVPTSVVSAIQGLAGEGVLTPTQIRDFAGTAKTIFDNATTLNVLQLTPLAETLRANNIPFNQVFSRGQVETFAALGSPAQLSDDDLVARLGAQ